MDKNHVSSGGQSRAHLVLIDGNAILHRAFHAMPPLTTSDGRLVNAVYGFLLMLFKLIDGFRPEYLAVCFDKKAPTFRKQIYVGYQAKRPKMADELSGQIELVHEVLKVLGIEIYELDGFEADDVIGTLAKQASDEHMMAGTHDKHLMRKSSANQQPEIIIVTGDKDLLQLVNDKVKVYMPVKGLSEAKLYGEKEVEEKLGVKPVLVPDYKALVGDSSDNYPGVAGVGPKTALGILRTFGTLENLYKNLGILAKENPGLAKKLAEGSESAGLCKQLATIMTDTAVTLDLKKCKLKSLDRLDVIEYLEGLEFRSLIPRLKIGRRKTQKTEEKKKEKTKQMGLF